MSNELYLQEHSQVELDSWGLVRVNEEFRVIALGLPSPRYPGHPLDPPLRSRFQAKHVPTPTFQVSIYPLGTYSFFNMYLVFICIVLYTYLVFSM